MRQTSAQVLKFVAIALLAGWVVGPHAAAPEGDVAPAAHAFPLRFEGRVDGRFAADAIGGRIEVAGDRISLGGVGLTLHGSEGATLAGDEPAQAPTRVFTESAGGMSVREIDTYRTLRARGVAPGVDAVVSGTAERVDLRLEIAPGAAESTLVLETNGAVALDAAGRGRIESAGGSWIVGTPIARVSGDERLVAPAVRVEANSVSALSLPLPAAADAAVTVEVPIWRLAAAPALDPAVPGPRIALDAEGSAYVTSHVPPRSDNPSDAGDVLVAKLDREGRDFVWASYLTGLGNGAPAAIAADGQGRIAVAGRGFVALLDGVTGLVSAHVSLEPSFDVRAVAFDRGGDLWIGGAEEERGVVARIDSGCTVRRRTSVESPVAAIAIRDARLVVARTAHSGSVLDVLSADGEVVASATIDARVSSLAIDRSGRAVVAGSAGEDVVLAAIDPESGAVTTLQVLAGPGADAAMAMTLDPQGRILVAGRTQGRIVPDPAPTRAPRGGAEGFAAVYDATGSELLYGTYLGGSDDDAAASIAVDGNGRLWVAGRTVSTDARDDEATWPLAGGARGFVAVLEDLPAPARPSGVCPGTRNFDGGGATEAWDDPLNWDNDALPSGFDDVCISGAFSVTVPSGSQSAATLRVEGGASLTINGGTLTIAGPSEIDGPLTLSSGILTGSGNIATGSSFDFNAGTLSGTGTLSANAGLTLATPGFRFLSRNLTIPAGQTLTYSGTGGTAINAPATLVNAGTWNHQTNANLSGTGLLVNSGTFNRTTSAGLATLIVDLNNSGTVDVQTGGLSLSGDGFDTGDYDATGALLRFSGGVRSMSMTTTITGDDVDITNGTYIFDGTYDVAGTTSMDFGSFTFSPFSTITSIGAVIDISAGTLSFDSGEVVATGAVVHLNGTITGSDAITVSGIYAFDGGVMSGDGTTTASGGANFGSGAFRTISRNFVVAAGQTAIYSGTGGMAISTPATLTNAGTWQHESDAGLSGTGQIVNSGTFNRVAGAGAMSVGAIFNNTGTLEVAAGTLHLANYTQDAGTTRLAGGNLSTGTTPVRILGGALDGSGTVTGHVAIGTAAPASGAAAPGLPVGAIAVTGTTTFAAGGTYACEIGGLTAGTQHDFLGGPGAGPFAVGGALDVSLINGFTPGAGDSFTIIQGSGRTGTFTTTSFPPLGDGNIWNLNYTPTTVVLSVGPPIGADLSVTKTDSPDPANTSTTLTYIVAVSNAGPSAATSLVVVDALPAGVTLQSATGTGWSCTEAALVVTCTRASLAAGASSPITIVVTTPTTPGLISNGVSVGAAEEDPVAENNAAAASTSVVLITADLSIVKTDSADPVDAGAPLTYTLDVANAGPDPATTVTVTDTLPAGVVVDTATGPGWICGVTVNVVTCTRADLAVAAAPPITIAAFAPIEGGSITNTATVSSPEADNDPGDNTETEGTVVTALADLAIAKTDSPDPVAASGTLTYTLDVANAGPSTATSLTVTDTLPAGVGFESATSTGFTCTHLAGVVTCTRAVLAVGVPQEVITIVVTAPASSGQITNTASVTAAEADPSGTNNTATATTNVAAVAAVADMSIAKASASPTVGVGGSLTWTITVRNLGPSPATDIVMTDFLPAGVSLVSATGTGWTCAGPIPVSCTRPMLAVGSPSTITLTATAPLLPGTIVNTATIEADENDPNAANDTGQSTIDAIVGPACGSLEDLLETIGDADLDPTLQRTLEAPVRAAIGLERAGQLGQASAKLGLFQQHCTAAAAGGRIDAEDAAVLLECASSLRSGAGSGTAAAVKTGGAAAQPAAPARRR